MLELENALETISFKNLFAPMFKAKATQILEAGLDWVPWPSVGIYSSNVYAKLGAWNVLFLLWQMRNTCSLGYSFFWGNTRTSSKS